MNLCLLALCLLSGYAAGDHVEREPNAGDPELLARYPNFLVLSSKTYELYWKYTAESSRLDIAVSARTTGWVGFGVSERGNMVNADIAVGWVTDQGDVQLQDHYSGADGFPPEDTRNDLNLIRGKEDHGWTTLEFWRSLDTGDTGATGNVNHDRIITEGNTPVIFALGERDSFSGPEDYHMSNRGAVAIYFLEEKKDVAEEGAQTVELLVRNITIPSADTTYWCAGFRTPPAIRSSVKHVIKFAPVIHEPATPHVHHMLLYTCDGVELGDVTDETLVGANCYASEGRHSGTPLAQCTRGNLIAAWAVGGDTFVFPDDVSFSFGGPESSEYLVIEMHYDNPNMIAGVTDSSGFELTFVDTPRRHNAGTLAVGGAVSPLMVIPPNLDNFNVYGICDSACTNQYLPEEGVNVFANILHTHLAGHGVLLRQYRNGVEVTPPIDQDLNYDFNFQQIRTLPSRKIYPGDRLEFLCKYQTADRNSTVFGGLGTYQEMCLSFLFYYPRSPFTACVSSIKAEHLLQALRIDQIPSVNLSAPDQTILQQVIGVELPNSSFPWSELSRIQNLQRLNEASRTNSTLYNIGCLANRAIVFTAEDPTSGSSPLFLSSLMTVTASFIAAFILNVMNL